MRGVTGKVWGTTEAEIVTPLFEAHRLTIKPMHRCSMHSHERKWNAFLVVSGRLFIDVRKKDYPLVDVTELGPGDMTTVKPGEDHQFRTGEEPCIAVEFYYPEALSEDIVRRDHGGALVDQPNDANEPPADRAFAFRGSSIWAAIFGHQRR